MYTNISEIKIISSLDCDEDENGNFLGQAEIVTNLINQGWVILHFDKDKIYLGLPRDNE